MCQVLGSQPEPNAPTWDALLRDPILQREDSQLAGGSRLSTSLSLAERLCWEQTEAELG